MFFCASPSQSDSKLDVEATSHRIDQGSPVSRRGSYLKSSTFELAVAFTRSIIMHITIRRIGFLSCGGAIHQLLVWNTIQALCGVSWPVSSLVGAK